MANESFYDILSEMKEYAGNLSEFVPAKDISGQINNWTDRLGNVIMEIIQIDAHDLCDACVLIMKAVDGINEGKLGIPASCATEESQAFVSSLKTEMVKTLSRFMETEDKNNEQ